MYIAYIRCSKQTQNTSHQHHEIQEYAKANGIKIDKWIEEKISSRKPLNKRQLGKLLEEIKDGDIIISDFVYDGELKAKKSKSSAFGGGRRRGPMM